MTLAPARGLGARRAASAGGWTPSIARRSSSPTLPAGTWRAGLDRAARRRDDDRGRAAAVRGRAAAGRRRERGDRPRRAPRGAGRPAATRRSTRCAGRRPSPAWAAALAAAADALTRRARLDAVAARPSCSGCWTTSCARPPGHRRASSSSAEVRALLAERLQGRPTRANFRTGHLTICTLVPMRSVPHRVVCLLGLDDGTFPRKAPRDGDDLMLDDPHVGERDSRTEDRQLLLDALMAADGPADHHLHGQRRAHERRAPAGRARSASCSTSSGRDVVVRASAAAVRPAQLHTRRLVEQAVELRPRDARGSAGADGPRASARAPFLPAPLPPRERGPVELDGPRAVRRASGARVPAPAARDQRRRLLATRSATRCRSSSTRSSSGASASGCSDA